MKRAGRWTGMDAEALRDARLPSLNSEMVQQVVDALHEHVAARLSALPAGWRVAAKLDMGERSVARMTASWTIKPLGPCDPVPAGWNIYGPLAKACDTERGEG